MDRSESHFRRRRRTRWILALACAPFAFSAPAIADDDPIEECRKSEGKGANLDVCLDRLAEEAEKEVEESLEDAGRAMKKLDKATGRAGAVPALRASHVGWQRFRLVNCRFHAARSAREDDGEYAYRACWVDMTRERKREVDAVVDGD